MSYSLYCIYFKNSKRYYGITKSSVKRRIYEHTVAARKGSKYLVHKAMRKHEYSYRTIKKSLTKREAIVLEIRFISKYKTQYTKGYNQTSGGDGVRNLKYTPKIRKAIAKSQKRRFKKTRISPEAKIQSNQKAFYVYKKDGTFVGMFYNQTAFARKYKISQAHINECLYNFKKRKAVKDMIFSFSLDKIPFLLEYGQKFQWNENSRNKVK